MGAIRTFLQKIKKNKIKYACCAFAVIAAGSLALTAGEKATGGRLSWDALFTGCGLQTPAEALPEATVDFLNVGQGDSTLITCGGQALLVDAGHDSDAGTIHRAMQRRGAEKLDYVIITHPHSDHCGGLSELLRTVKVGAVYMGNFVPESAGDNACYNAALESAYETGTPVYYPADHQKIALRGGVIEFYVPDNDAKDENNSGLIALFNLMDTRILFMGDNGADTEEYLLSRQYNLSADILHVGHHGSKTATTAAFSAAVSPDVAVISFGYNNYGHPADEALSSLQAVGAKCYYTFYDNELAAELYDDRCEMKNDVYRHRSEK